MATFELGSLDTPPTPPPPQLEHKLYMKMQPIYSRCEVSLTRHKIKQEKHFLYMFTLGILQNS